MSSHYSQKSEPRVCVPDTTGWAYIAWILQIKIARDSIIGLLQNTEVLRFERGDQSVFNGFKRDIWNRDPIFTLDWFDAQGNTRHVKLRFCVSDRDVVPDMGVKFEGDLPWQRGFSVRPEPNLLIGNQLISKENAIYSINKAPSGWEIVIEFRHTFEATT